MLLSSVTREIHASQAPYSSWAVNDEMYEAPIREVHSQKISNRTTDNIAEDLFVKLSKILDMHTRIKRNKETYEVSEYDAIMYTLAERSARIMQEIEKRFPENPKPVTATPQQYSPEHS